jgi:hypothetical protein
MTPSAYHRSIGGVAGIPQLARLMYVGTNLLCPLRLLGLCVEKYLPAGRAIV